MEAFFAWLFHNVFRPVFWFQPCFYALHGWLATEMAIWLLFHPYEPMFLPGTKMQIPLTPGILPRGRGNLFQSIATTVTSTLLTESDVREQAKKLITEQSLVRCIESLLDSVERELRNTEQIRRIYRYGEEVIPDLLRGLITGLIDRLENESNLKFKAWLAEAVGKGLAQVRVEYAQSEFLTNLLFNTLLTPHSMRKIMVDGLTDGNILLIEKNLSEQVGGIKGFLVRFMGVAQMLTGLREFFKSDPESAEAQITEVLDQLEIRERLAERISRFSFAELPLETQEAVQRYSVSLVQELLTDNRPEISGMIAQWGGSGSRLVINRLLQVNLKVWLNEKRPDLKLELARFLHQYLHRELAVMVQGLLPIINIGQMIMDKLEQFSNQQLERMIYGICHRELRWLAFLGAFLGFWLGLLSNLVNYFLQA